ncbi:MAG: DUF4403 family protein [Bacteroidetes bacterium]|nr:DUF4403 family protein [Bacteroidota bacterium]
MMKRLFYFVLWLAVLSSCKAIEPVVPENFVEPYPALNNEVSYITIPVEMDLSHYLKAAEKEIPQSYSGKNEQCEGMSTSYFIKRDEIKFSGSGDKVGYELAGQLKLKINYCPKCQTLTDEKGVCIIPRLFVSCGDNEPMRKFNLKYSTAVKVNSDYAFKTTTNLQKFELLDPCELTIANIDVTKDVEKEITKQLKVLELEIDKQFSAIDIKSMAKESWKLLQESTEIPGYGYLSLAPSSLAMSELKFSGKKARFNFNLGVSPSFTTEKPQLIPTELPVLGTSAKSSGLNFGLDVILSYDSLTSFLRSSFVGKTFEVKRKKISIDDVQISGSRDSRIILKTKISGSKKGIIYLLAQPVLNDSLKLLELKNVDFEVETRSLLLKSAKWFFNSKITELIQKEGSFNYASMVEDMKAEVNNSLNQEISKGVRMSGAIHAVDLRQLFYTANNLLLRAHLSGNLKLILE